MPACYPMLYRAPPIIHRLWNQFLITLSLRFAKYIFIVNVNLNESSIMIKQKTGNENIVLLTDCE